MPYHTTGHPILNDPLYSHPVWQSQRRRVDREKDEDEGLKMEAHTEGEEVERKERSWRKPKLEMEIIVNKIIQSKFPASSSNGCGVASSDSVENSTPGEEDGRRRERASVIQNNPCTSTSTNSDGEETKTLHISTPGLLTADKSSCDPDCTECRIVPANPLPSDLIMYLHALSYKVFNIIININYNHPLMLAFMVACSISSYRGMDGLSRHPSQPGLSQTRCSNRRNSHITIGC